VPGNLPVVDVAFPWDPLRYPFDVPLHSFMWTAGGVEPLPPSARVAEVCGQRHPVLAIGSNASPGQLTRKFSDQRFTDPASPQGSIPVLTADVDDVDVVYGAHLAWYGSLPATLLDTPGACARVFITWLTTRQLETMNDTEGLGHAYQLRQIGGVRCHGDEVDPALSYVTMAGACVLGGHPLALGTTEAPGSWRRRGTQRQAWAQLATDMGCDVDGPVLMERVLGSPAWRAQVESHLDSHRLAETSPPFTS
jgi:hypothetical protein